jgi:uncharacterized protein YdeI (YjbR/CyaY-like superfamily)
MSRSTAPRPVAFESAREAERWFERNHAKSRGIWVRFFKKDSGVPSATYQKTLDCALCFGWIDGQLRKHDDASWLRKFTPRRSKSTWSKKNTEHAERLIRSGRMRPAGLREIEAARKDGRWKAAYDPPSAMHLPAAFLKRLQRNRRAKAFFESLNRANLYAIAWRLQTAKTPETREKRLNDIVAMLSRGQKFHG